MLPANIPVLVLFMAHQPSVLAEAVRDFRMDAPSGKDVRASVAKLLVQKNALLELFVLQLAHPGRKPSLENKQHALLVAPWLLSNDRKVMCLKLPQVNLGDVQHVQFPNKSILNVVIQGLPRGGEVLPKHVDLRRKPRQRF